MQRQHNGLISILKFLFMLFIIIMHIYVPFPYGNYFMEGAYIFVDFFFILQGFYMSDNKSAKKEEPIHVMWAYIRKKIKRFASCVIIQAFLLLIVEFIFYCDSLHSYVLKFLGFVLQVSFISSILPSGFMEYLGNGTLWFLSASVFGGAAGCLFLSMPFNESKLKELSGFIALILYNYIISVNGNVDLWWEISFIKIFSYAIIRAVAGIFLGFFCRYIFEYINDYNGNIWTKKVNLFFMGGGIVIMVIFAVIFIPHTMLDFFILIGLAGLVIIFNMKECFLYSGCFCSFLEKIAMPMYIFQVLCVKITNIFIDNRLIKCCTVIALDFFISLLYLGSCKVIQKLVKK